MKDEFRGWLCLCANWYAGEDRADLYEVKPDEMACHRWQCGWVLVKWEEGAEVPPEGPIESGV